MAEIEDIQVPVGELTFDGIAAGPADGEVVLLLHGFPQTSWSWRHQLEALGEAGYRAVAFDQRGYSPGARPEPVGAYRADHLVADAVAVIDWLGPQRFHVVGHDWGGAVAWQVAARHPERLRSLTVLSTPHPRAFAAALAGELGGDQLDRSGYMAMFAAEGSEDALLADDAAGLRAIFAVSGLPEDDAAAYVDALRSKEAMRAALNWYRAADVGLIEGLGPITTPTLYVWSTDDPALGREAAEATAAHVEGPYRFEVLDGVSHWIAELAPEQLNPLLLEHLASADR